MKKKVLLVTLLVVAIVASCFAFTACNKDKDKGDEGVKVAMITDFGDITDQSFNQTTYEACKAYCDANNIKFKINQLNGWNVYLPHTEGFSNWDLTEDLKEKTKAVEGSSKK